MTILPHGVSRSLQDVQRADEDAGKLGQQLITGRKIQAPADGPSQWLEASRTTSAAGTLDVLHTGLNEVATNIGVVDTTMQAIGNELETMQSQLEEALKYPAGDPSRTQLLQDFNTVRQQVDDLVNTTSPAGARNLMSDPAKNPQAGAIQALVGPNGETKTVRAQVVDTGPAGLNIPSLRTTANDVTVQGALDQVSAAQSTLAARRQGLGADAADISRYEGQISATSSFYQSNTEALTSADTTEAAVQLQSVNTQRSLAVEALSSIGTMRSAVLELLQ
jgi:flagellin-like hook-associated protein FlgL